MNWLALIVAGLFEIAWAIGLKHTDGWSKLWPSLFTLAAMLASFQLLSQAQRRFQWGRPTPLGRGSARWV